MERIFKLKAKAQATLATLGQEDLTLRNQEFDKIVGFIEILEWNPLFV